MLSLALLLPLFLLPPPPRMCGGESELEETRGTGTPIRAVGAGGERLRPRTWAVAGRGGERRCCCCCCCGRKRC